MTQAEYDAVPKVYEGLSDEKSCEIINADYEAALKAGFTKESARKMALEAALGGDPASGLARLAKSKTAQPATSR